MNLKKGKVVTITSTKGGVGKTITIFNLATIYSKMGLKTLILDMDFFGGVISTLVDSNNDKTIFNLVEDLSNNRYEKLEDYIFKYSKNIHIVAAPKDPRSANKIDFKYIPLILNTCIYKYDVVLIDTNHILNENNIIALDNSDSILYLFTNDVFDLKNSKSFMSIVKDTDINNCVVALNESVKPDRNYFSMYDIKNIIKRNVDFVIPRTMHIKNIDKNIMNNTLLIKDKNTLLIDKKGNKVLEDIAKALINDKEVRK